MNILHQAWERLLERRALPGSTLQASEIKALTGLEPRLMAKFDRRDQLPPALAQRGLFLLPVRNGEYCLVPGDGYHDLEPCPRPLDFPSRAEFACKTAERGQSEMQFLDLAYNTGILSHFLESPTLYPTIRGRKRSPLFRFRVGASELTVEGVQVEVDAGFESPREVVVVEAKIDDPPSFHLRQLYYPFRFWSQQSGKRVRPVFFTYTPRERVYRLREYHFDPAEVFRAPRLVKAAAYRLVARPGRRPLTHPHSPARLAVPQADDLDKVARLPFLVAEGNTRPEALAGAMGFSPRQGAYYAQACEQLGLIEAAQGAYQLTEVGRQFVQLEIEARHELLCRLLLELPVLRQVVTELLLAPGRALTWAQLEDLVRQVSQLGASTAARRSGTLRRWFGWIARALGFVQVEGDQLSLVVHPPERTLFDQGRLHSI